MSFFLVTSDTCMHPELGKNSKKIFDGITSGISIFFESASTSLFTGGTFYKNLNNFHEYLIQHTLKSGGTKDHFRHVKVPGTTSY